MTIDEMIEDVISSQKKIEENEKLFEVVYPESWHENKYETKKYNRAKEHAKLLFKKFLKKIDQKYFIIIEKLYNDNKRFTIGKLIDGKFAYLKDYKNLIWRESYLNFGFPPKHTYLSWYAQDGPDAKRLRFRIHRGWSINLEYLFSKINEYNELYTFDDEESMLLFYEMMKGE